jgi:hypothetical protein
MGNEYIWDSVEWLAVVTAPLIIAVPLVNNQESMNLFIGAYVCIIVIWGIVSVGNKKINVKIKNELLDDKHRKQARLVTIPIFIGMIIFVILTFYNIYKNIQG